MTPGGGSVLEVLLVSLRLGLTSFGGPMAHLGYQHRTFVKERGWLSDRAYADIVALGQILPGPTTSQISIAVGRVRAGWAGALAAWIGFTLPSAAAMTALGLWATSTAIPTEGFGAGAIAGLKAATVAIVAHAVWVMARRLTPGAPEVALAALVALALLAVPSPFAQAALIAAGGAAGWAASRWWGRGPDVRPAADVAHDDHLPHVGGRRTALVLFAAFAVALVGPEIAALATGSATADFVAALTRSGALVFGGGHVVLPLLDAAVVGPGWVDREAFVAGYGATQAMPGPIFSFGSYLGAVASAGPGGLPGAIIGTIAIFLPGGLLVLAALPVLGALRARPGLAGFLRGVNVVVVGILAAALVSPVGTSGITSPATALVAAAGIAGLLTDRVPPLAVVIGSALLLGLLAIVA